ncbi:hypothetical protein C2E25_00510 [Geothermobacter hydrogeniphilus]|uniref:Porin domain-containing protein n=2 Tax=Geothermobacter hydrogeniphilus TaxID=1969733 RepID=A0A2K2HEM7_9BACT|nr:hypothetical protein C2E25_00510 [Geothermobacter hydrogeniphilus]
MGLVGLLLVFSPHIAMSASLEELERRLNIVTAELQKMKNESAVSEAEYQSIYGFGPAASKVYTLSRGLSIGGYGEAHYTNYVSDQGRKQDQADFLRFVLYSGYKFTDSIILNSEIEFEHASTEDDGAVSLEFSTLDFLLSKRFNLRAGLMLIPIGITNELHEPTLFHGNDRPLVERYVIPTTWREMGIGAFGELAEGLEYKLYLVNGLDATGFDGKGIRGGRQDGSKALAEDWAIIARLDYEPLLGLNLGAGTYLGNSGQGQEFAGRETDVFTRIYEAHVQYKVGGLELKALGSRVRIDDTDAVSAEVGEAVPERISGWYGEVAYDVLPLFVPGTDQYLAPFVRYEQIDYRGTDEDVDLLVAGISYKPTPNVVVKADYRNVNNKNRADTADEVNLGIGFIF